ncbi:hypothetical protein DJ031_15330 [bacterium endosymbiont of Escarpia laminata]|nr:MAG: hypothetical protein DJ031_15330 [bacterium endosymbiont of Escarpia laminata]
MNTKRKPQWDQRLALCTKGDRRAFSRFVLPFSWKKEKGDDSKHRYIETSPQAHREKIKYFTQETGKALYKKAKWLTLEGFDDTPWGSGQKIALLDRGAIQARMEPPRLVLFEWDESGADLLHSGFLLVDIFLEPHEQGREPTLDDLLTFNEFFRYIDCPYDGHYQTDEGICFQELFKESDAHFLVERVQSDSKDRKNINPPEEKLRERLLKKYFDRWVELLRSPITIDGASYRIIGEDRIEATRQYLLGNDMSDPGFLIHADNRAYVWTAASLEKGVDGLQALARTPSTQAHDYGHWIKLLNVDMAGKSPIKTHRGVREFEQKWAKERTYHRWEEWGTWYGFTYHSGAALMKKPKEEPNFIYHFSTFYFDIVLLLLYLRVSLFRFSNELGKESEAGLTDDGFRKIREQFAHFTIRYQFPILSNQQQAIEMYTLAREHFDLDDLHKEVKAEIHETHEYLEMVNAAQLNKDSNQLSEAANRISSFGIPLAAGALAAGVFGMNIDDFHFISCLRKQNPQCVVNWEAVSLLVLVIVFISIMVAVPWIKRIIKNRKTQPKNTTGIRKQDDE